MDIEPYIEESKKSPSAFINLYNIRTSVIAHWLNEYGLMEAMVMAGHSHIITTKRYETKKYDELLEQLKSMHPIESFEVLFFDFNGVQEELLFDEFVC